MWKLSVAGRPRRRALVTPVDAAEAQGLFPDVELVEAGQAGADDDVALLAELVGAAPTLVEHRPDQLPGVLTQRSRRS